MKQISVGRRTGVHHQIQQLRVHCLDQQLHPHSVSLQSLGRHLPRNFDKRLNASQHGVGVPAAHDEAGVYTVEHLGREDTDVPRDPGQASEEEELL